MKKGFTPSPIEQSNRFFNVTFERSKTARLVRGFTLIELLIVIGILAILATAVVLYLNPAQILAESRDTQRLSDLQSVVNAISVTQNTDPLSDFSATNVGPNCTAGTCNPFLTGACAATVGVTVCGVNNVRAVDGTGWVGFNFGSSSPIPTLPIDPVNLGCVAGTPPTGTCYAYSYNTVSKQFELDTILESVKYSPSMASDGGNNADFYELGTNIGL